MLLTLLAAADVGEGDCRGLETFVNAEGARLRSRSC